MKKSLPLITLIFLGLVSCDNSKHCYKCLTKITTYKGASETNSSVNVEICDKSRFEINKYAKEKSETSIKTVDGIREEKVITTDCSDEH